MIFYFFVFFAGDGFPAELFDPDLDLALWAPGSLGASLLPPAAWGASLLPPPAPDSSSDSSQWAWTSRLVGHPLPARNWRYLCRAASLCSLVAILEMISANSWRQALALGEWGCKK